MVKFYIRKITITDGFVQVDYEIILDNGSFQGAVGGGTTNLPLDSLGPLLDSLKEELEAYIEKNLGMRPSTPTAKPKTYEEEDPL